MNVSKYSTFLKIEHTIFSLPLIFSGAFLAQKGWPSLRLSLLMIGASVGARVVALALNRIIDRTFDRENPRTKDRHLTNGSMTLGEAWCIVACGLILYFFSAWRISIFCLNISWIPLVGFAAYPFFKRFTKWTHVGLGLVWSFIPLAGYVAVTSSWKGCEPVLVLSVFCVFWLAGFDIIYSTLDEAFDRSAGLYSLPSRWGRKKALTVAGLFHFFAFVSLGILYLVWFSGPLTLLTLLGIGSCLYIEQKLSHKVDLAFFKMNALIGLIILVFVMLGVKGY